MRKAALLLLPALALGLALLACDSDDGATCASTGKAMCVKACACGGEDGCVFGGEGGSISFDDQADCEAFLVGLGCQGGGGAIDWDGCQEALDGAQCTEKTFVTPQACEKEE